MQRNQVIEPKARLSMEEAKATFRNLVQRHGLEWTAKVPKEDYELLAKVNEVLGPQDRREALGLPRGRG